MPRIEFPLQGSDPIEPGTRLFELPGQPEERRLGPHASHELQADGQA